MKHTYMKPTSTTTPAKKKAAIKAASGTPAVRKNTTVATGELTDAHGHKETLEFSLVSESEQAPLVGVSFHGNSATFDKSTDFETWERAGMAIAGAARASTWFLGDWLNFGSEKFPKNYKAAVEKTGLAYGTLRTIASICQKFPAEKRYQGLTFEHHRLLAPISDEKTREALAQKAATEKLGATAMRELLPDKPKTPAQEAKAAAAADDRHRTNAREIILHLANLPQQFKAEWFPLLASLMEAAEKALPTCKSAKEAKDRLAKDAGAKEKK